MKYIFNSCLFIFFALPILAQNVKNKSDSTSGAGTQRVLEVKKDSVIVNGTLKLSSLSAHSKRQVWVDEDGVLNAGTSPQTEAVTSYYNIPSGSFTKMLNNTNSVLYSYAHRVYISSGATDALIAPVNLPHGATITNIKIVFLDNSDYNLRIQLLRTEIAYGATVAAQMYTSGNSIYESWINSGPLSLTVNNDLLYYSVAVSPLPGQTWMGALLYLKAIVITYEL